MRKALVGVALTLWLAPTADAARATQLRILYATDWSGPTQIYAVDPAHNKPLGQLTFAHVPPCPPNPFPVTCGFIDPIPAPDGRHILFRSNTDFDRWNLWVANADGTRAHVIVPDLVADPGLPANNIAWSADSRRVRYRATDGYHAVRSNGSSAPCCPGRWQTVERTYQGYDETVVSPDRRWTAFADKRGIGVTSRKTGRTLLLAQETGFNLAWSPDSKSLAYIAGFMHFGTSSTGDLRVVTLAGKVRTIVARNSVHGGGFVSVTWTRTPATVRYRKPAGTDGVYAGGEVARLAADGTQVAFAACNSVYAWTPPTSPSRLIDGNPFGGSLCFPPTDRVEVYDLAVSDGRVAFGRAGGGLTTPLELSASPLSTPAPTLLTRGSTNVGGHMRGVGTLAGADGLLVYSSWDGRPAGNSSSDAIVSTQSIFRVDSTACPCPAIASVPAQGTPVDVDDDRIVVVHAFWPDGTWASRTPSLALLDRTGTQLLSIPVDAAAAQLDGRDLVAAVGGSLLRFDAVTGELIRSRQVSTQGAARDCLFWAGPDCVGLVHGAQPRYVLQDLARGLVTYTLDGKVHLLRLSEGTDSVVGFGRLARFLDDGLVYADGARVHFVAFGKLPRR